MVLERKNFSSVIEEVKNEICCNIPTGLTDDPITEIKTDAFLDWEKLQYVYIPNSIKVVWENAFCWENIKIVFADIHETSIKCLPKNVKILPITGNEKVLFSLLEEIMKIKKQLEFNPEDIEKKDRHLNQLLQGFIADSQEYENKILNQQQHTENILKKLENYSNHVEEISEEILSKVEDLINKSLTEDVSSKKRELEDAYMQIKTELTNLQQLLNQCSDTKTVLETIEKNIKTELAQQTKKIEENIKNCLADLSKEYEESKKEIVKKMVEDATNQLIEKNPCKNIIININDVKEKFNSKDIFHQDFEKVLQLVSAKKPILLKGPAGSGKNVIIEQVAKALNLQFYYCNDVTDEYKIMGFVDANGRFIETQFFKAFTKGGIIFIDEIDSSNPSALLAINASIGTGYNHYMAFPDGNFYQAHQNFHLVAAANTFGTGADMIYCGRQALDGATLNRFIPVTIDYDRNLERTIITHKEILNLYWQIRDIIQMNMIRHVISTRNIKNASDLLDMNCFELGDVFDWTIIQGLEKNDLNIICSRINDDDFYSQQFLNHAQKKYKIDQRI